MQKKLKSRFLATLYGSFLVIFSAAMIWLSFFDGVRKIEDWQWLRSYAPTAQIEQLAIDGSYTEEGTNLFYLSDPRLINDGDVFNQECNEKEELSIVLGCFTAQSKVFVFNVNDSRLPDVEEVTAAHEMLHVAWSRFSDDKKKDLAALLDRELSDIQDSRLNDLIDLYRKNIFCEQDEQEGTPIDIQDGGDCESKDPKVQTDSFNSELHSIIGTELSSISSELESHYSVYFEDRQIVVDKAQSYAQTFIDIGESINEFDRQLEIIGPKIDEQQAELESIASQISIRESELVDLRENDKVSEYNSLVPIFNQLVNSYNEKVNNYENTVSDYNDLVKQRNQQAYIQRDLVNSINSNFSTL